MPTPIALCLENPDARGRQPRWLGCVALAGGERGLGLGPAGEVLWRDGGAAACELWVSLDERLILYRTADAPEATVTRAGRTLQVPAEKPVVLLQGDEIGIGPRRLRVHVHGPAAAVRAPAPVRLPRSPGGRGRFARAAAAAAIGSAAVAGAIEVRTSPPKMAAPPPPPIEVREAPPVMLPPEAPREVKTEIRPYTVLKGDTLNGIVRKTGGADTVKDILARNGLASADRLKVGQVLKVKTAIPK